MSFHRSSIVFGVLIALISLASLLCSFAISFDYLESSLARPVAEDEFQHFPVVVVTTENAELMTLREFEGYRVLHPDASVLIPEAEVEQISEKLKRSHKASGRKGIPELHVRGSPEGLQLVTLQISRDGIFEALYQVGADEVRPIQLKLAGPGFIFLPIATAVLLTVSAAMFLAIFSVTVKRYRRTKLE